MNRYFNATLLAIAALLFFALTATAQHSYGSGTQHAEAEHHQSGAKEYKAFHDILHPLQHEALPSKDFATMRAQAGNLVTAGEAIIKRGIPEGVEKRAEFTAALRSFNSAITQFKADADKGSDAQIAKSFSSVHDSFEALAEMLPRK